MDWIVEKPFFVTPANAGVQLFFRYINAMKGSWIPASAGMTEKVITVC
jgi:hypothetical protein